MEHAEIKKLIASYHEGVLESAQENIVKEHLNTCSECRQDFEDMHKFEEVMQKMALKQPKKETWEAYWSSVYNRLERGIGWIILSIGAMILLFFGGYKLVDFGLASSYGTRATRDRRAPGYSSGYSPPEQVLGRQIDRRSDVYSLAATFYELLAGNPPHARTDYAAAYEIPEPIKGIPKHVNAALLTALSKSPVFRPASAMELLDALEGNAG